jgi:SAM-dependent methyltransferase
MNTATPANNPDAPEARDQAPLVTVPCPACGSLESRVALTAGDYQTGQPGEFSVSLCGSCGLRFQNPRVPAAALMRFYPDHYNPYSPREAPPHTALIRHLRRHLGYGFLAPAQSAGMFSGLKGQALARRQLLPRFVPEGRLLEIGCASGARLALLRDLGWIDCSGMELSASAASRARDRGFPVITGPVEDALAEIPDGSLDVVIAGFVMEHLDDPFAVAKTIAAKLRPGGQFLFSTLTLGAPDFHLYGRFWHNLDLPRHRVFFRRADILRMLQGRFRVESLSYLAAPQDYTASAEARLRHGSGTSFGLFTRAFDRLVVMAGNRLYPLCVLLARLGLTSRIAVRCRKA